eukprot:c39395_g1_i1.p1 GENE.c39395_g1_i1~~c39395_g1_i1.p1  ORF type:complete len:504 (+),score=85.64 c39395_g1_i1:65-1576(+)
MGRSRVAPDAKPVSMFFSISYGIGHHLNDLCAACWFTYLLIYLESDDVGLSQSAAGTVLLAGQVADALATPVTGLLSDATPEGCQSRALGLGRRKLWHLLGTLLSAACFWVMFGGWQPFSGTKRTIFLAASASIFNVGWAAVQVAHLALVPELNSCDVARTHLQSSRFASTIAANLEVFGMFLLASHYAPKKPYMVLALGVLGIGLISSLWFYAVIKEQICEQLGLNKNDSSTTPLLEDQDDLMASPHPPSDTNSTPSSVRLSLKLQKKESSLEYFKEPEFYTCGVVYMAIRLVLNISQTYIIFFITNTLHMPNYALSAVPATLYVAALAATAIQPMLARRLSRAMVITIGGALCIGSCAISAGIPAMPHSGVYAVFAMATLLGVGNSTCMITSVSMVGDLAGSRVNSAAFLYGLMSFTDKLSNGLVIFLVQLHRESLVNNYCNGSDDNCEELGKFTRLVMSWGCGAAMVVGMVFGWFTTGIRLRNRAKSNRPDEQQVLMSEQ